MGVGLIGRMDKRYTLEEFTKLIFDGWGIGNIKTNNGILIFLSIEDRIMRIATGKGAKSIVSDKSCKRIIESMKPDLKNKNNYGALILALDKIDHIVKHGES